jgi:hypothetical protein
MQYRQIAILRLISDTREKLVSNETSRQDIVMTMNALIVESAMKSLWRYSTPTLFEATERLHRQVTGKVTEDTFFPPHMEGFHATLKEFCTQNLERPKVLLDLVDKVLADLEREVSL